MATRQNELEAVLAGLIQGVIVVDQQHRLISINDAAASLLSVERAEALGKHIEELIANNELRQVVVAALQSDDPVEGHVVLPTGDEDEPNRMSSSKRFLRVQDTTLYNSDGSRIGWMIVLQDVTRLRLLESVRRDFVANVSHEIKTPVTAVKAAVETLLSAGVGDLSREQAARFLQIIARQAERLQAIVEDLLTLARIEQDAEHHWIVLEPGRVGDVVKAAIEACEHPAQAKSIRITPQRIDDVNMPINRFLLEQAVVNLLDNAIKYSPASSTVWVNLRRNGSEAAIEVRDEGPGIATEHLERIFERFYRTDKARSRELGGTGLGLAIVKHVAQAHGGRATVESTPGIGSTFRIHLPLD